MAECFLCNPPTRVEADELPAHLRVEHDVDLDDVVQKWPDGEWVVHDTTLEPGDFQQERP